MQNTIFLPTPLAFIPEFIQKNHELSMAERMTYAVIASVSGRNNFCWHSQKELSDRVGCSLSTLKRCIRRLTELGLLVTKANVHGHTLCYFPLAPSSSKAAQSEPTLAHGELQIIKDNIKQRNISPLPPHRPEKRQLCAAVPSFPPEQRHLRTSPTACRGGGDSSLLKNFEKLWAAYPKKEAIGLAKHIFFKMKGALPSIDCLLDCISFKMNTSWADKETRYIPALENFLKGERWLDDDYVVYKSTPKKSTTKVTVSVETPIPEIKETPEEKQALALFLSSVPRDLFPAEKAIISAFWRQQHRKGITLTAQDGAKLGHGALYTELPKLIAMRGAA